MRLMTLHLMSALIVGGSSAAMAKSTSVSIFFDADSTAIKPAAAHTLNYYADILKKTNEKCPMQLTIVGHMDNAEASAAHSEIDVERAQAAVTELKRLGRESWTFVVISRRNSRPLVPSPPNASERENRRVEVDFQGTKVTGKSHCDEDGGKSDPPRPLQCWVVLADGTKCEYP